MTDRTSLRSFVDLAPGREGMILRFPGENPGELNDIRVSVECLRDISAPFNDLCRGRRLLDGNNSGVVLEEDDWVAMNEILRCLHGQTPLVQKPADELADIARHCAKYNCMENLGDFIKNWMGHIYRMVDDNETERQLSQTERQPKQKEGNLPSMVKPNAEENPALADYGNLLVAAYFFAVGNAFDGATKHFEKVTLSILHYMDDESLDVWREHGILKGLPDNIIDKLRVSYIKNYKEFEETIRYSNFELASKVRCSLTDLCVKCQNVWEGKTEEGRLYFLTERYFNRTSAYDARDWADKERDKYANLCHEDCPLLVEVQRVHERYHLHYAKIKGISLP